LAAVDVRPLGSALTDRDENAGKAQDVDMTVIMKTREERREELKRLAAMPNGIDKVYAILTRNFIPFEKLPIGTLMIEAILDHEYSEKTAA
jgi:precorrin-2 methylase